MNENCKTFEVTAILEVIDGRLARIERAVVNPKSEPINARRSYSRQQAASALGVSVWTIDRARKDGLLCDTHRLGPRNVRITGESILAFQRQREGQRQGAEVLPL